MEIRRNFAGERRRRRKMRLYVSWLAIGILAFVVVAAFSGSPVDHSSAKLSSRLLPRSILPKRTIQTSRLGLYSGKHSKARSSFLPKKQPSLRGHPLLARIPPGGDNPLNSSIPVAIPGYIAEIIRYAFGEGFDSHEENVTIAADAMLESSIEEEDMEIAAGSSTEKDVTATHNSQALETRLKADRNEIMHGITEAKRSLAAAENALFRQGEDLYGITNSLRAREAEIRMQEDALIRERSAWEAEKMALKSELSVLRALNRAKSRYRDEDMILRHSHTHADESFSLYENGGKVEDLYRYDPLSTAKLRHHPKRANHSNLDDYEIPGEFQIEGSPADVSKKKFRILSIDGGGIRGIVPAVILRRLAEKDPDFLNSFDLITGTSTGALISIMVALGADPREIEKLYYEESGIIFHPSDLRRRANPTKSKYTDKPKKDVIERHIGPETTFQDLKKWTLITAFRLDGKVLHKRKTFFPSGRWRPSLFTNIPKWKGPVEPDLSLTLVDAAMATSAAPTYFPVYKGYIDGGLFATNPSLCAIGKVCAHFPHIKPEDIVVLSLGCGGQSHKVEVKDKGDWGMAQWAPHLLSLFFDTNDLSINLHMTHLLGDRYHRLDPMLVKPVEIDDIYSIPILSKMAEEIDLEDTISFIQENFIQKDEKNINNAAQPQPQPLPHSQQHGVFGTQEETDLTSQEGGGGVTPGHEHAHTRAHAHAHAHTHAIADDVDENKGFRDDETADPVMYVNEDKEAGVTRAP